MKFSTILGYIAIYLSLDATFIKINDGCFLASKKEYACGDLDSLLNLDPEKTTDIKYVCDSIDNFTNQDFADRINYRFNSMGIHMCDTSIMNDLDKVQFRNQCPTAVKQYCSK